MKELFEKFGEIRSAKVVKKELESHYLIVKKSIKVFGFVCFFEPSKAQDAKTKLKETSLLPNGPKLYVDYHQTKQERTEFLKLKLIKENPEPCSKPDTNQAKTQNNRNLKEEKEIFEFNFYIRTLKNPEFQIIKNIILLQVDDCVRLVNISNKIVFNYFEPNEYPLHCECS